MVACTLPVALPATTQSMFVCFKALELFSGCRRRIFWDMLVEGIWASTCVPASVSMATLERRGNCAQVFSETSVDADH